MNYQRLPQLRPLPPPAALRSRSEVIEWEHMPSLHDRVRRTHEQHRQHEPAWNATRPMGLWQPPPPKPFEEVMDGLHMREIETHEVFEHFFGAQAPR